MPFFQKQKTLLLHLSNCILINPELILGHLLSVCLYVFDITLLINILYIFYYSKIFSFTKFKCGINYIQNEVKLSPLPISKTFRYAKEKLCNHEEIILYSLSLQHLVSSHLLSASMNLPTLGASYQGKHTVFVVLHLVRLA